MGERGGWRRVFFGAGGLRWGWGLALYIGMLAATGAVLFTLLHFFGHHPKTAVPPTLLGLLIAETAMAAGTVGYTRTMGRIERRKMAAYGYALPGAGRLFGLGLAVGFGAMSAIILLQWALGYFSFGAVGWQGGWAPVWGAVSLLAFVLVGVSEEALFRGYVFATLRRGLGFWPAVVADGVLFALAHTSNKGETLIGLALVALTALAFCLMVRATGSLWLGIGVHGGWDWAQSFVYGVPDSGQMFTHRLMTANLHGPALLSGGSVGPEGSIFAIIAVLGGAAVLLGAAVLAVSKIGGFAPEPPLGPEAPDPA